MRRNVWQALINWKDSPERKPLVLKGPLTEHYVLRQLWSQFGLEPRYYSGKNREIDFLTQNGNYTYFFGYGCDSILFDGLEISREKAIVAHTWKNSL